jgi:3',5'-cyclic-nucleotide phosphodiesterase
LLARHFRAVFNVIPLGVEGNDESNLPAYAVAVSGTDDYVCLDAGTVYYGIQRAVTDTFKGTVLKYCETISKA